MTEDKQRRWVKQIDDRCEGKRKSWQHIIQFGTDNHSPVPHLTHNLFDAERPLESLRDSARESRIAGECFETPPSSATTPLAVRMNRQMHELASESGVSGQKSPATQDSQSDTGCRIEHCEVV